MSTQTQAEHFTNALYSLLDEAFDNVHGYFLDRGISKFEMLATISAEEAAMPVGDTCAMLIRGSAPTCEEVRRESSAE
jgi:hypothetical protein